MEIKTNIKELKDRLKTVKEKLEGSKEQMADAIFSSINAGMGFMKRRIFNNSEDANGEKLGKYTGKKSKITEKKYEKVRYSIFGIPGSNNVVDEDGEKQRKKQLKAIKSKNKADPNKEYSEYEKYRLSIGRQIEKKDLQLNDDLFKSIHPVKDPENSKVVIMFADELSANKAKWQEQQIGNLRAGKNGNTGGAEPVPIFQFSEAEYNQVKEEGERALTQLLTSILNGE